jgi:threonine aldolase
MGLKVHMDGARIFNAATALDEKVAGMTRKVDSVMFCLSKGLGAPVGSMVVGTRAFIEKGRVYRKMFGGGMRQAGVIAAAGLIALEKSPGRLHIDHENARRLAEGIAQIRGLRIDAAKVRSNIVIFDCSGIGKTAVELCEMLHRRKIWAQDTAQYSVRLVTHVDVNREGIERALVVLADVAAEASGVRAASR